MGFAMMAGCASTRPDSVAKQDTLKTDADTALARFHEIDPSTRDFMRGAWGYAVFPTIGKGGAVAGGAYGRGSLYEKGMFVGWCDMTQATFGAQLGGQTYSQLIVFETPEALNRFKDGNFAFAANASAVAAENGAARTAKYENGVAVFVDPKGGLMAEAAIGGQKFNYVPADHAETPRDTTAHIE
jgi:lipid-binding SYLF domain-containing protein